MLHAFPRTVAPPPPPRAARSAAAALAPLTPAAYLRLRREAAGLTVEQVAARIAPGAHDAGLACDLVRQLEKPGRTARHPETLDRLRAAFAFDADVYRQLVDEPAKRHPRICRGCGCSQWDACDEDGHGCTWVTHSLCSRCNRADAARMEQAA